METLALWCPWCFNRLFNLKANNFSSLPQIYTPYNKPNTLGLFHQTPILPMASEQSTHLETSMHVHTISLSFYLELLQVNQQHLGIYHHQVAQ
jgi:hypothetical protein